MPCVSGDQVKAVLEFTARSAPSAFHCRPRLAPTSCSRAPTTYQRSARVTTRITALHRLALSSSACRRETGDQLVEELRTDDDSIPAFAVGFVCVLSGTCWPRNS